MRRRKGPASRSPSALARRSIRTWSSGSIAMTAAEARARGTHQALTPVVDVARDPRWGRVEETFGEDPYLVVAAWRRSGAGVPGRRHVSRQDARHRDAETLRRARPARIGHQLRAGERLDARAPRDVSLDLQGGDPGGRRDQRDAVLQRDRRRAVACEPWLAAQTCCADEWGFHGLHRLRLLRDPRAEREPAGRQPSRGARRQARRRTGRPRRRGHRTARSGLLSAPRRSRARGRASRNR